jgi:hypothetical protein
MLAYGSEVVSQPAGTVRHVNPAKLLRRLARGELKNVAFDDARRLVEACGFELVRVRGSHRIYVHRQISEKLNLQPCEGGGKAVPASPVPEPLGEVRSEA